MSWKTIFPGLKKWPLADGFHKVQVVTDSMVPGDELYAQACRYATEPRFFSFQVSVGDCMKGPKARP